MSIPILDNDYVIRRCSRPRIGLTHLPLDTMAAISQTIFSYAFSWRKLFILIKISPKFAHSIYWRIYAALWGDELIQKSIIAEEPQQTNRHAYLFAVVLQQ